MDHEPASRDFTHGLTMMMAARRCDAWVGDELTERRLQALAGDYRVRAIGFMMADGAAQPEQANRTPTDARNAGATPRAIRNDV